MKEQTNSELVDSRQSIINTIDSILHLSHISTELLSQREGSGVLEIIW